jgi:hypothetical protein
LPSNETGACPKAVAHSPSVVATVTIKRLIFRLPKCNARISDVPLRLFV